MNIGFIGLGIMGRPMAGHLIDGRPPALPLRHQAGSGRSDQPGRRRLRFRPGGGGARRCHHHHGSRHPACRSGAVRSRRRRRRIEPRQDRGRHEFDLADRHQEVRRAHQRTGLRLPGRAGVGRRSRRQGRQPDHHGRRTRSGLREGQAAVRADGQEHHAGRRQRRRPDHQGRQPDHRGADHRGGRRGAAVRRQGRRRSGQGAPGADGRLRLLDASWKSMASAWSSATSIRASASSCTRRT